MNKYTESEKNYLIEFYHKEDRETILKNLYPHSWVSIKEKAKRLNLSRPNIRKNTIKKLIENNFINCYWWGLIMSDGYISNKGHLKISLQKSDSDYLKQLSDYLNIKLKIYKNLCVIDVMDKINCLFLKNKLNITERKTYNPPINFNFLISKWEILAFLIGFIDGDGCIQFRENNFQSIRIVIHENWFDFMTKFSIEIKKACDVDLTVTKNGRGNTCVYIGTNKTYQALINFINENKLPIMKRKWKKYEKSN